MKNIAIVGLGLIGEQRIRAVKTLAKRDYDVQIRALYDPYKKDLETLITDKHTSACHSLDDLISIRPDLTIIAIPHDEAAGVAKNLLRANLKVLIEKPLGRNLAEAKEITAVAAKKDNLLVSQNYRFFPGVAALLKDIRENKFGQPIGFSLTLGHGGSPTDKNTWKLDKIRCGGGVLIDPGIHLIDICNMVCGTDLEIVGGNTWSGFWDTGIEEECRFILRNSHIPIIDITLSVVRWRSTFRMEFFGTDGYGLVQGRGRSYGPQQYVRGKRWGWQSGKSQTDSEEIVLVSSCEDVFADELESVLFNKEIDSLKHACTLDEALHNMTVLEKLRMNLNIN